MFSYYDNANRAYNSLVRGKRNQNLSFDKASARDNSMYNINEGYNLKEQKESFLEKLLRLGHRPSREEKKVTLTLE